MASLLKFMPGACSGCCTSTDPCVSNPIHVTTGWTNACSDPANPSITFTLYASDGTTVLGACSCTSGSTCTISVTAPFTNAILRVTSGLPCYLNQPADKTGITIGSCGGTSAQNFGTLIRKWDTCCCLTRCAAPPATITVTLNGNTGTLNRVGTGFAWSGCIEVSGNHLAHVDGACNVTLGPGTTVASIGVGIGGPGCFGTSIVLYQVRVGADSIPLAMTCADLTGGSNCGIPAGCSLLCDNTASSYPFIGMDVTSCSPVFGSVSVSNWACDPATGNPFCQPYGDAWFQVFGLPLNFSYSE